MEYGRALKFPFADAGWLSKMIIGVLLGLVPIANFATYGYGVEVLRRVAAGDREELPAWDQFGRYFRRGVALMVASLVYTLPGLLVLGLAGFALRSSGALLLLLGLLALVYLLCVAVAFPAAIVRYALTDEWYTMFDFSWVLSFMSRDLSSYIVAIIVLGFLAMLLGMAGAIAFGVGVYFTSFWSLLMVNHGLGQLARSGRAA